MDGSWVVFIACVCTFVVGLGQLGHALWVLLSPAPTRVEGPARGPTLPPAPPLHPDFFNEDGTLPYGPGPRAVPHPDGGYHSYCTGFCPLGRGVWKSPERYPTKAQALAAAETAWVDIERAEWRRYCEERDSKA